MNSCIYRGRVLHRRLRPTGHSFRYRLFMLYLDLAELETVFRGRWLWSARRPNIAWFRRREHLGPPDQPLEDSVRDLVMEKTGTRPSGPVRLLTHLRYFGFQMNPVSFFFCFDQTEKLEFIVAEVNNTPWGEQHCYVLGPEHFDADGLRRRQEHDKEFHVSPFMPMDMTYQWRVSTPNERLSIGISNFKDAQRMLNVAMTMQKEPLTAATLRKVLWQYPMMTVQVFAGIYWQAFRLRRKRVPFFAHPGKIRQSHPTAEDPVQ